MPLVAVVMGSKSDNEALKPALEVLDQYEIDYEVNIISAHRTPEKARQYGQSAKDKGIEVIIAAAGGAAHLPGVLASWTTTPVIGVPLASNEMKGQMGEIADESFSQILQLFNFQNVSDFKYPPGSSKIEIYIN